jgi:hypothetical protein
MRDTKKPKVLILLLELDRDALPLSYIAKESFL